jgi:hypothetical protein
MSLNRLGNPAGPFEGPAGPCAVTTVPTRTCLRAQRRTYVRVHMCVQCMRECAHACVGERRAPAHAPTSACVRGCMRASAFAELTLHGPSSCRHYRCVGGRKRRLCPRPRERIELL